MFTITLLNQKGGGGKSTVCQALAVAAHLDGKSVAIVCPNHDHAETEYKRDLGVRAYKWEPKTKVCTCYDREWLKSLANKNITLPHCQDGCPYLGQYELRKGKIGLYQYQHLTLNGGELLKKYDLIIIDESFLSVVLQELVITAGNLRQFRKHLESLDTADPALPLVSAVLRVVQNTKASQQDIRGADLLEMIQSNLVGHTLEQVMELASLSKYATRTWHLTDEQIDKLENPQALPKHFFGRLLEGLRHDSQLPNPHVDFGLASGKT